MKGKAHALHAAQVTQQLAVDATTGLSHQHVAERRARHGPNVLPSVRPRRIASMIVEQFANVIVLLLAVAAIVSWMTGERSQAMAIIVVLMLNAVVGFITEWQSGRALDALRKQTRITVQVRRGGRAMAIPAEELTVGDIVLLSAGDRVPADLRVLEAVDLRVEEAALTGESRDVAKSVEPVSVEARLADRSSMLFLGTVVTAGRAVAIVVGVGSETELGRIGLLVTQIEAAPTALQRRLQHLGHRLVYLVMGIAAIVTLTGWLRGDPFWQMLEVGISLAVAAVPEALPAVTTFILAFGVLRMARRNAIVRRLASVETLGSTTVICCDKTGTLTLNEMTVVDYRGFDSDVRAAATVAALCNEASGNLGDPTELALLRWAEKAGIDVDHVRRSRPRVAEQPFDPKSKRMITVHRQDGRFLWAMKGAPSVVLDACRVGDVDRARFMAANHEMASRGLRVLALAEKRTASADDESAYAFLGLVGMTDPPRPGVIEAIATARAAGIRLIMLTGDQVDTARAIATELHIADGDPRVRHAREIDRLSGDDLARLAESTDAFARVSPEEKYRIVEALQRSGEIVAVTGDGINDAPALKKADVGVAMGMRGTEVAKEASDIVLADDNFATIVAAVEGGRSIYANIVRFVHMMFSHNLNEVLTIFIALVVGWPLPLLPLQILWLNLVTDVFPAFALALEPASPEAMRQPPRDPRQAIFSAPLVTTIGWQAAMLAVISLSTYAWALRTYGAGAHARTIVLLALVGVQIGHTFNCRSRVRSALDGLFRNPHLWFATGTVLLLQSVAFIVSPLANLLGLVRPAVPDLIAFAAAVVAPIVVVDLQKVAARRSLARLGASR